jgi:hypothetical protein
VASFDDGQVAIDIMNEQSDDLWERAEADAAKIAPRPRIEPLTAGIAGGIGVFIALEIFSVLSDLPRDRYGIAATVTCALGFGVPWLVVCWPSADISPLEAKPTSISKRKPGAKQHGVRADGGVNESSMAALHRRVSSRQGG